MGKDDDENARVMAEPWCSTCHTFGHSAEHHAHHAAKTTERRIAELTARVGWLEAKLKLTYCERHGHYTRTDENVCPACMRGE
jgi:hypothetical protein